MYVIYVDSEHRVYGSETDFIIALPQSLIVEQRARVRCDQIRIPLADLTVNPSNCYIYLEESIGGVTSQRLVTLRLGNYGGQQLACEIKTQLNTTSALYQTSFNGLTGELHIEIDGDANRFRLLAGHDLMSWSQWPPGANAWRPMSFSHNLHHPMSTKTLPPNSRLYKSLSSIFPSLRIRDFYIRAPTLLSENRTIGPNGEYDIIAKVSVDQVGGYIMTRDSPQHMWVETGPLNIKEVRFLVTDSRGEVVSLQGLPVSFTISIEQDL